MAKYNKKTNVQLRNALRSFNKSETGQSNISGNEREDDVFNVEGILKQIELEYIKEDGWIVEADGKEYRCTFTSTVLEIPEGIQQNGYLIPANNELKVKVSIDKISGEYNILSIVDNTILDIINTGTITLEKDDGYLVVGSGTTTLAYNENIISIDEDEIDISGPIIKFNGITLEESIAKAVETFKEDNGL